MTRKDYEVIVGALTAVRSAAKGDDVGYEDICRSLAVVLGEDNPRFDRERFLAACGVSIDTEV